MFLLFVYYLISCFVCFEETFVPHRHCKGMGEMLNRWLVFFQFLGWIFQSFEYPFLGGWISRFVNDLLRVVNDMPPVFFFFHCCILCFFLQLFLYCGINYATIWVEWNNLHFFYSVLNDLLLMLYCIVNYMMWNRSVI